jgi:hypothetical protein
VNGTFTITASESLRNVIFMPWSVEYVQQLIQEAFEKMRRDNWRKVRGGGR